MMKPYTILKLMDFSYSIIQQYEEENNEKLHSRSPVNVTI